MKFAIITHTEHIKSEKLFFGYSPYVREMNIWLKHVDEVIIVAPVSESPVTAIHSDYKHSKIDFREIKKFDIKSGIAAIYALFSIPKTAIEIYKAMKKADHIHLRCPGNIGLLGCLVQIFFPNKTKTAKYAGNWDPKSKQPISYRLQKWILSNTFLTKKMQVLVYGEWANQTKNIKPFFTATYNEIDKISVQERNLTDKIKFIYAGTLSAGKRPLIAVQVVETLYRKGYDVSLDIFGEGVKNEEITTYLKTHNLLDIVNLRGNQSAETVREAYIKSHFLILASQSEGWPKVVAEAMFWGCVPVATRVSCVPNMLENGKRGVLLDLDKDNDVLQIENLLNDPKKYFDMSCKAKTWSRNYTLDSFELEIKKLLKK